MTKHEQDMLEWGCPNCQGDIELYDTNPSHTGGKYKCKACGRTSTWAVGTSLSLHEALTKFKEQVDSKNLSKKLDSLPCHGPNPGPDTGPSLDHGMKSI